MITLTADELTTLAEVLGHEPPIALVTWVEETIAAHRDEATVMADLIIDPLDPCEYRCDLPPGHGAAGWNDGNEGWEW